jgi:hypothetical protein
VDFVDRDHGWAVGVDPDNYPNVYFVLRTRDGGGTWEAVMRYWGFTDVSFADTSNGWTIGYCEPNDCAYRTTDGGVTWTLRYQSGQGTLRDVACIDRDHAWLVGTAGTWGTSDGGATWNTYGTPLLAAVSFLDGNHGRAAGWTTYSRIYRPSLGESCEQPQFLITPHHSGTMDDFDDCPGGPVTDMFHYFTCDIAGWYSLTLCADRPGASLLLRRDDCCSGTLLSTQPLEDTCSTVSGLAVAANLTVGTTYFIECGLDTGIHGANYTLQVTRIIQPLGATCDSAITISSVPYQDIRQADMFDDCPGEPEHDMFYAFTPGTSGWYLASLCGSEIRGKLKVWSSCCSGSPLSTVVLPCDAGQHDDRSAVFLTGGQSYYFECGTAVGYAAGSYAFTLEQLPRAPNVTCATAYVIPTVPFLDDGLFDNSDDCFGGPKEDVFYRFTPSTSGWYPLTLCTNAPPAASIRVRANECCSRSAVSTQLLADTCFPVAGKSVAVNLTAGVDYFIECGTDTVPHGAEYTFQIGSQIIQPPGAACSTAIAIDDVPYQDSGTLDVINDCLVGPVASDMFYAFTPDTSGWYQVFLCTVQEVTVPKLRTWAGGCCTGTPDSADAVLVECPGGQGEYKVLRLTTGTTYHFECGVYQVGLAANYTFSLERIVQPLGAACENPIIISSVPYQDSGHTEEFDDCSGVPLNDMFYSFAPSASGWYLAGLCGSEITGKLEVWNSCCSGTPVSAPAVECGSGSDDDKWLTYLTGGESYYFECGTASESDTGTYVFSLAEIHGPDHGNCATALQITTVPYCEHGVFDQMDDCGQGYRRDVFYHFVPPHTGSYQMSLCSRPNTLRMRYGSTCCPGNQHTYSGECIVADITLNTMEPIYVECGMQSDGPSVEYDFSLVSPQNMSVPEELTIVLESPTTLRLHWLPVACAARYRVYQSTDAVNFTYSFSSTETAAVFTVPAGSRMIYRVTAEF